MPVAVPAFLIDTDDPHEWGEKNHDQLGSQMRVVEQLGDNHVYAERLTDEGEGWSEVGCETAFENQMHQLTQAACDFGEDLRIVYIYGADQIVLEEYTTE